MKYLAPVVLGLFGVADAYAALAGPGNPGDEQTSLAYDGLGRVWIDPPASKKLTSINITSAGSRFIGPRPQILDGPFDNYSADNIFKATFGKNETIPEIQLGRRRLIEFGHVLPAGLSAADVTADLTVVGSLEGGGDLGPVDLCHLLCIPEPSSVLLVCIATLVLLPWRYKR